MKLFKKVKIKVFVVTKLKLKSKQFMMGVFVTGNILTKIVRIIR